MLSYLTIPGRFVWFLVEVFLSSSHFLYMLLPCNKWEVLFQQHGSSVTWQKPIVLCHCATHLPISNDVYVVDAFPLNTKSTPNWPTRAVAAVVAMATINMLLQQFVHIYINWNWKINTAFLHSNKSMEFRVNSINQMNEVHMRRRVAFVVRQLVTYRSITHQIQSQTVLQFVVQFVRKFGV